MPRGMGTGLSGGATAVDGGIVLSTEKMRDIAVDPVTRTAVVQPGLLNAEVKKAAAEHGLWYPPDPSSFEICSIGGNIATNAGGLCCVKYGVTTDYVLGLEVVLADGTAVRLGGPRLKDVAGLSLTKLFVGSEGTLGIITEVTLRLLPAQHRSRARWSPRSTRSRPPPTPSSPSPARSGRRCSSSWTPRRSTPSRTSCGWAWTATPPRCWWPPPTTADPRASRTPSSWPSVFTEHGATEVFSTDDPDEGEAFVAARRFAIPAVEAKGSLLLEDVGVPLPRTGRPGRRHRARSPRTTT